MKKIKRKLICNRISCLIRNYPGVNIFYLLWIFSNLMIKKNILAFLKSNLESIIIMIAIQGKTAIDKKNGWNLKITHNSRYIWKKTCFKFFLHYVAQTSVGFCSSFFFLCFVISKEMGLQLAIFFPFVATGVHKVIFGQKLVSLLGPSTSICIGNRGRPFRFNLM